MSSIKPGGWAAEAGPDVIASGDVIVAVGGAPCRGAAIEELTRRLQG